MASFSLADLSKIAALLSCAVLLLLANGLQATLVPARAELDGFSVREIGWIGTTFFAGFVLGSAMTPTFLRRVGHVRGFSVLASLTATLVLVHPLLVEPWLWSLLRAGIGFAAAGMYAIIESWLNSQANNANRGRVFTTYATLNSLALVGGNYLFTLAHPSGAWLFTLTAILTMLCLMPVCLTVQSEPQRPGRVRLPVLRLYTLSPAGFFGAIVVGLAGGAFWTLAISFAQARGLDQNGVALFMSAVIFGGALAQWPLGRMSDFVDRRIVILAAAVIAVGASLTLALAPFLGAVAQAVMFAGAFAYGASAFPIGSLANAHLNDRASPTELTEMASGILFTYGVAATIGPFVAAEIVARIGVEGLFYFAGVVHALYAVFIAVRMAQRGPAEHEPRPQPAGVPGPPRLG
ncbi:MAG TPA: MFS transporter [Alphaproteobacteria bacterium]|nr:MFS transporter [Alphaproteobacteria bacterium]